MQDQSERFGTAAHSVACCLNPSLVARDVDLAEQPVRNRECHYVGRAVPLEEKQVETPDFRIAHEHDAQFRG